MKVLLLITAATATLVCVSAPALARHRHHHFVPPPYAGGPPPYAGGYVYGPPICASPLAVCSAGTYVGSDPDPRMRAQMLADYNRGVYRPGNR
jgi:hypothetical protein